ncbi:hypothetical protein SAMN02787118_112146 [Streptomyces mirabilis]|uniref:Uncharacterized protein n=1 Tax=Streptomyces mirabilis TaxID=68239 RepID=A0A1I2LS59_9ACTN|nr:hypothetical protein SAMN02787118_112146 [Streptomyces mirabilis]
MEPSTTDATSVQHSAATLRPRRQTSQGSFDPRAIPVAPHTPDGEIPARTGGYLFALLPGPTRREGR